MVEKLKNYLCLMRIKHYLKNLLIFFPLVFSINLFNISYLVKSFIGFLMFSLVCSVVYIINDIRDIEKDKLHSKKKYRPLPSGRVSLGEAYKLLFVLFILLFLGIWLLGLGINSIILLLIYLLINLGYSFGLKNVPLVDIIILVFGFLLRVLFGASVINVPVSSWLYLTIMAMSFYLALGKRRNEIIKTKGNTRNVLKYYTKDFLDKNMYMCLSLAITFYSLWTFDDKINSDLIWSVPLLIIVCMRYNMIVEGDDYGDPMEVVSNDKWLIILMMIYGLFVFYLVYFG